MILYLSSKHLNKINDNIFLYAFYINPLSILPFSILEIHHQCLTVLNGVYKIAPRHSATLWHQVCVVYVQICDYVEKLWVSMSVYTVCFLKIHMHQCYVPTCLSSHRENTSNMKASMLSIKIESFHLSRVQPNDHLWWYPSSVMDELCKYSMLIGNFSEEQKNSSRNLLLDCFFYVCVNTVLVPQMYHFVN